MTLTLGTGPFSRRSTGRFNFSLEDAPAHVLYIDEHPRRVRAELGGETVLDSTRGRLLHETQHLPVLYVPLEDLRQDLLEPTDHSTHCPFKGEASYYTLRAGDRVAENAVWYYPDPIEGAAAVEGYAALAHDAADAWYEEDELVLGHLRDPFHRVDVRAATRHVRVTVGGEVIAETDSPKLVYETGLPVRHYIPPADVRLDLLRETGTHTVCPYKGTASYWSIAAGGEVIEDAVFGYPEPLPESVAATGHLCFGAGEGVEVEVSEASSKLAARA